MAATLEEAQALLPDQARGIDDVDDIDLVRGEIDLLQSQIWFNQNEYRRSLECSRRASELLPISYTYAIGQNWFYNAHAKLMLGQGDAAVHELNEIFSNDMEMAVATRVPVVLADVYLLSGELYLARQVGQAFASIAVQKKQQRGLDWIHSIMGRACYEINELDEAAQHFAAVSDMRYEAHVRALHDCTLGLALTYLAQGKAEQANATIARHTDMALEINAPFYLIEAQSFQARLALLQCNLKQAVHRLQSVDLSPQSGPMMFLETPLLTRAKVLVAQGTLDSLSEADQLLADLRQLAKTTHITKWQIEILAVQALFCKAQERTTEALDTLEQAIALGKPRGFIRTFVDLGPPMTKLLYQLADRGVAPDYIGQILAAFPDAPAPGEPGQEIKQTTQAELVEALSARELEVLELIAGSLSDREIAQDLTISVLTAKTHARNIYRKLDVKGRMQAVAKAKILGILPPD